MRQALVGVGLAAAALLTGTGPAAAQSACRTGDVQLISGYSGSPDAPCIKPGEASFLLDIVPEARPINPSPWYGFQLSGPAGATVTVTLNYTHARHRYRPWVRHRNGQWQLLDQSQVQVSSDQTRVALTLALGDSPLEVAAQPVYGLARYESLEARWPGDWQTAGTSVEGRRVRALVLAPEPVGEDAPRWIVLLGGQHPPEVPGAWAFEAFSDVMVERYHGGDLNAGLIVIPLLNPDGVDAGHWRLNAALADLNRDWALGAQPEVQAVAALLDRLNVQPGDIELMVDFHATVADRLYLPQPEELSAQAARRLDAWLAAMEAQGLFEVTEPRRTNPARRVSAKAVFTDEWQAIALTWEAGDNTPEAMVRAIAGQGAQLWRSPSRHTDLDTPAD